MNDYKPIACGDYDYLEIACMDHYEVEITYADAPVVGVASQLLTRDGQEFLLLKTVDGTEVMIRIDRIKLMRVLTRPTRFTEIQFAPT